MHADYLQGLRYKLQKRIRRLKTTGWQLYIPVLRQFWSFFDGQPTLVAITEELQTKFPESKAVADQIFNGVGQVSDDEQAWAAVSLEVMRRFAQKQDSRFVSRIVPQQSSSAYEDHLRSFGTLYVDPFYEYIDERLDDPRFVLGQLIRFKHLCEWFRRDPLFDAWCDSAGRGEKTLALKLYEFLFTEGIRVHIEPWSASGEADMVGSQEGSDRLIADAKVFDPDKGKGASYIIQGFRQIYCYTADYNEPIGYLVIFNTSEKQLRIAVRSDSSPVPNIVVNHKTIFFLGIDLYPHETSASKRPKPEIVDVSEAEIVGAVAGPMPFRTIT